MLAFSRKCRYGLKAVLALAGSHGRGVRRLKEIAEHGNIPRQYLEQIFNVLLKANIVRSIRGKNGGYALAREPSAILVLEVVEVLEGGLRLAGDGKVQKPDVIDDLLLEAENSLRAALQLSLADLLTRQDALRQSVIFHI